VRSLVREAFGGVLVHRRRAVLSALGVALAAAMLATAAVVGYGLSTGFSRSARAADLPDVIARFDDQRLSVIAPRLRALPGLAAISVREEVTSIRLGGGEHFATNGVLEIIGRGRRGYAIVAGRDVSDRPGEVVVEQGVAQAWGLHPGSTLHIGRLGPQRVVGVSEAPDNVAYPLAAPRVYLSDAGLDARFGHDPDPRINTVELWLARGASLDQTLVQARATSYGIRGLRFVTRDGVRVLLDQAAGIVIALLVALSALALITAGVMLAAAARAEVQRRLASIGVRRALGASRGHVTALAALEALIVGAPAAAVGVLAGALVASGPSGYLLEILNEMAPGSALILPLAGCWLAAVSIPVAAAAWPSWRVTARAPVALLAGAELRSGAGGRGRLGGGLVALGSRLVNARRARLTATLAVLGASTGFILLMLALASQLSVLENDPGALGKRYELTAALGADDVAQVRALPGVAAAAPRYELTALDSFSLGETIDVIAYPARHTTFESPSLASGRRLRGQHETEVGVGLAQVLGLSVGSTLALELPSGREVRFRVAGTVSSLDHDGRVAFVPAGALLAADPTASEQIAVRLTPGASSSAVSAELATLGAITSATPGATGRGHTLIGALTAILRAVALVNGLVCLYTLIQALTLTVTERRTTIAVLRACGAGRGAVARLLVGVAIAVVVPAAAVAVVLERLILGPAMAHIAASYATLALGAGAGEIALVLIGLALVAGAAVWSVSRQAAREPIVAGLSA